jgi:hypothetical protein
MDALSEYAMFINNSFTTGCKTEVSLQPHPRFDCQIIKCMIFW